MTRTRKSILIVLGILATLATGALLFTSCGSTSSTTARAAARTASSTRSRRPRGLVGVGCGAGVLTARPWEGPLNLAAPLVSLRCPQAGAHP